TALLRLFKTNIVCTSQASCTYPSEEIPWALIGTFLRPVFPSCIGKNYFPSASWTGFRQGYYRCAGSNRRENAQLIFYQLYFRLWIVLRIPARLYNFSVQNIVTATTWARGLNLQKLARENPTLIKYEVDLFPGALSKLKDVSIQLFTSGKQNIVGARSEEHPVAALVDIASKLERCSIYVFRPPYRPPNKQPITIDDVYAFYKGQAEWAARNTANLISYEHVKKKNKKPDAALKQMAKLHRLEL